MPLLVCLVLVDYTTEKYNKEKPKASTCRHYSIPGYRKETSIKRDCQKETVDLVAPAY